MKTPDSSASHLARRRVELFPTLAAVLVVLASASLGTWQLMRADEKRALQAQREAARTDAPIALGADLGDAKTLDGHRVRVLGRYLAERTVFIDNRTLRGMAGFHVVTPMMIEGSQRAVLVLRGWVASDPHQRTRLPEVATPTGLVAVEGVAQATIEQSLELGAAGEPGADRIWQNLDYGRFERWSGVKLVPLLIRESAAAAGTAPAVAAAETAAAGTAMAVASARADDGLVREWPIGGPDVSRHLGYAVQWFALALLAASAWIYYSLGRKRDP